MQQRQAPPNPWKDFFEVYLDLGYALHAEIARDPQLAEVSAQLQTFLQKIRDENDPNSEASRTIVHEVIQRFRNKSKQILFQESSYFDEELLLFPSIQLDVAQLWRDRPLYRTGLWQWIEQLYVIGNVCLHPNRKDKFLQAVRELKAAKNGVPPPQQNEEGPTEENMDQVVDQMASMFGMDQNPAMKQMMAKMAKSLHGKMANNDNPMAMLQSIVSGDLSSLGDLQQEIETDITASIEKGELSEADFQRSRDGMMQKFGGMDGLMQMAQGMGLQVPEGAAAAAPQQPAAAPRSQQIQAPPAAKKVPAKKATPAAKKPTPTNTKKPQSKR
jgi:hypothetical protein